MPRKIPSEKLELLNNKKWLFNLHVVEKFSIVEIARDILQVTPATVARFIKQHKIQSPSQQELREASNIRKYGVSNPGMVQEFRNKAHNTMVKKFGGHIFSTTVGKNKRNNTCLKKYGNINPAKIKEIKEKIKQTKLKDAYMFLQNKQWLYDKHYKDNKSITEIAEELKISWSTVQSYFKQHQITIRQCSIPSVILNKLNDKDWLYEQHCEMRKSFAAISKELGVQDDTVRKYAKKHGIDTHLYSSLPVDTYDKLTNVEWLQEQCITHKKNYNQIAKELNISSITVSKYCEQHDIVPIGKGRKISSKILKKLEDKEWLEKQHLYHKKPLIQIATELGFCDNTPTNSGILTTQMRKYNIPIRNFSHSSGEKQVLEFLSLIHI